MRKKFPRKYPATGSNDCNHHKDEPLVYTPPPQHKKRPHPLCDMERLGDLIYKRLKKVRRKDSKKRIRSEARDAAQIACCCGMHYLNRKTMTIELPAEDGSGAVGLGYAKMTDEIPIEYGRAQRSFATLYEIGWVVWERVKQRLANGQVKWLPSLRKFTREFFVAIGKAPWYDSWTGRSEKKAQKKARAAEAEAKAKESPSDDSIVALYQRVLQRAGGMAQVGKLAERLWGMINYGYKRDEDELVTFLEQSIAARAPP